MSETPMVTFSSVDNPITWNIEGESKCLVFASPSEAKRAEELFTAMQRALTAERERADRNQEDAERYRYLRVHPSVASKTLPSSYQRFWCLAELDAAIDAARRK